MNDIIDNMFSLEPTLFTCVLEYIYLVKIACTRLSSRFKNLAAYRPPETRNSTSHTT